MKKILIVEDEDSLREVYSLLFKLEKYDVHEASNGKYAIEHLSVISPDVIILDILMPVMGGLEFLEKAKLAIRHPKTKILVLSNLSDRDTLDKIEKLGAHKYLLKSGVSPAELVAEVSQLVDTK